MFVSLLFLLFSTQYIKINCVDNNEILVNKITPGTVETYQITYNQTKQYYLFGFPNKTYNYDLIAHFYSIDCNIEINSDENKIKTIELPNKDDKEKNMYSFKIENKYISQSKFNISINIKYFLIKDLNKDISCPLVINTMEISKEKNLTIQESSPVILFFDQSINNINLKYNLKPVSSMFLSFSFQEITFFKIEVYDNKKNLLKESDISYSSTLLLTNEIENINELVISIKHNDIYNIASTPLLKFELLFNYSQPKLLEKNYLNKEFITSNVEYRYFYIEVNEEQEGEIMLHDKRGSGILIGSIAKKDSSKAQIKDYQIYPKINNTDKNKLLNYDMHLHKLSFNFTETEKCEEGCFILISYYHEIDDNLSNEIVGFEFTLLFRIWDEINFRAQKINIPYNEFILGCFEETTVNEHYYSIYITNQTDRISLQFIGESIEGFYKFGKNRAIKNYIFNEGINYKNAKNIPTSEYKNNYISFTFRPRREEDKLSFYYFRVVPANGDDYFISPLDSNFENICEPERMEDLEFCFYILRNDFKLFSYNFSVFPSNQNKLIQIHYNDISNENYYMIDPKNISESYRNFNNTIINNYAVYNFINNNNLNYLKYILFIISFDEIGDNRFFGLHSTFVDGKKEIYPNIYSSEIFELDNINRYINCSLKYNFSLTFNWLNGEGIVNLNNYFVNQTIDGNYYGKYYKIPLMESGNNIVFYDKALFIFFLKLENIKSEEIIILGNTLYEFIQNKEFPLYFMLPFHEDDENIFINFRIMDLDLDIKKETNFEIKGIIIDQELSRDNKENKDFSNSIEGVYDICTKTGILDIKNIKENKQNIQNKQNKQIKQNPFYRRLGRKYVYIKISKEKNEKNNNVFIQILAMSKNAQLLIPINQYILRSFSSKDEVHNFIIINNKINEEKDNKIIIEFMNKDKDIKFELDNSNFSDKLNSKECTIDISLNGDEVLFSIKHENSIKNDDSLSKNFYIVRYHSEEDIKYDFNSDSIKITKNKKSIDISLDNIKISGNNKNNNISFVFYFNLFDEDDINKESLEVLRPISIKPKATAKEKVDSQAKKISKTLDYDYKDIHTYFVQIKVNVIKNDDYLYSKNLVYVKDVKPKMLIIIIIIIVVVILISLIVIACIFYKKKKKKTIEEVLQTSFQEKKETSEEEDDTVSFVY